nr:MAG TPA: hypothetical protein [Caudoviricetes sp.]
MGVKHLWEYLVEHLWGFQEGRSYRRVPFGVGGFAFSPRGLIGGASLLRIP